MGTIKRLKDEQDKLKAAENAVPGAYEERYTGLVDDQLSAMGAKNDAGFDYDTVNEAFKQYKANAAHNAQNGAAAAAATAQSLAGGYGADWANSVTSQTAANQTAAAGTSLADLRSRALQQWQNELSGENNLVDTLLGQEGLERNTAAMNTGAAQNWRDYLAGRVNQARQENSDFWGNVWNSALNVGGALLQGYDAYKGYDVQKKSMEAAGYQMASEAFDAGDEARARQILKMYGLDESQVDSWKESYANQQAKRQNTVEGLNQAFTLMKAGAKDAANEVLTQYGLDPALLASWEGMTDVQKEQMDIILSAMDAESQYGNDTGVKNLLQMAGLPTDSIDYSGTLNQRELAKQVAQQQALNNVNLQYQNNLLNMKSRYSSSGGSGSSGQSGSSGNTQPGITYSSSNVVSMIKQLESTPKSSPLYGVIVEQLQQAGVDVSSLLAGTPSTSTGSSAGSSQLTSQTRYGRDPWEGVDGMTGASSSTSSQKNSRLSYGQNVVNTGLASGKSQGAIMDQLMNQGFSDAEIAEFFNKAK